MRKRILLLEVADFWLEAKHDASLIGEKERFFFLNEIMRLFLTGYEVESRDLAKFLHGLAESKKYLQKAVSCVRAISRIPHRRISSC